MKKVIIVDYGLGNLFSISQALNVYGFQAIISNSSEEISKADALIVPGVGSFGEAIQNLDANQLKKPLVDKITSGSPVLAICLGMQILFEKSEESKGKKGLEVFKGAVKKFPTKQNGKRFKIPQVNWNEISFVNNQTHNIFNNLKNETPMYFVHSYYVKPKNEKLILCKTEYNGFKYTSGVVKNNIFAFQFHPEKSGKEGLKIYKNFLNII